MRGSLRLVIALAAFALGAAGAAAAVLNTSARPDGYRVRVAVTPNRSTVLNTAAVVITRNGRVVTAARVRLTATMLDMPMPGVTWRLRYRAGRYTYRSTVLGMAGRWRLRVSVDPPHGASFSVAVVDRVGS